MPDGRLKQLVRRSARAAWWIVTPWKAKARIAYLRERAKTHAQAEALVDIARFDQTRHASRLRHPDASLVTDADLLYPKRLSRLIGTSPASLAVPPIVPGAVIDQRTAAAFVIGLWRDRPEVRERFPLLFRQSSTEFIAWLDGDASLGLTNDALQNIERLLAYDYSARARQVYLANVQVRAIVPHGLSPVGMPSLLRWFARVDLSSLSLVCEEVVWLFLAAAQAPIQELLVAHAMTPDWQKLHPDGTTVFGRDAFAQWFAREFGVREAWLDVATWPEIMSPAEQVRTAYWARPQWQQAHPDALASEDGARALLDWLAKPESGLTLPARSWVDGHRERGLIPTLAGAGMNVIGHFTYPSGLRVSVESLVQAASKAGVAVSLRDVRTDAKDDPHHVEYRGTECFDVTLIHTQPAPFFDDVYARADLAPRQPRPYRIGYWYWEFDSVPESWVQQARQVDEVWTATEFVAKGLRERLSVPVRTVFPGVKLAPFKCRSRDYFGLEKGKYTFLFTFHMMSVMERKNPLGLIRAFRHAFSIDDPVSLVLKTSFGDRHPEQIEELRRAADGHNIRIIDAVYSPDEVLSLMECCDAYVSLHRSEGLGLTMAEAMLLGKPVIATNYSGNVDFMDEYNSVPVSYTLRKLGQPIPPYDEESEWAEPSLEDAAHAMRRLFDNQEWARELGRRGNASALDRLSLERAGRKVAQRLEEIRAQRR